MASYSERKCRMVQLLADAWWNLTDTDHESQRDIIVLVEHRLRDVLTDEECPQCAALSLQKELDKAVETDGSA